MNSTEIYNATVKQLWDSGVEEFEECPTCHDPVSRKDVGNNDVAIEFVHDGTGFVRGRMFHNECCVCLYDPKELNGLWEDCVVYVEVRRIVGDITVRDSQDYVGSLARCPYCFRIYDS